MEPVFQIKDLSFRRPSPDGDFVLEIEELKIRAGEAVAFVGPSGCGKSTLIDILAFLLKHEGAKEFLFAPAEESFDLSNETDLPSNYFSGLRKKYIGYVPQVGGLVPSLSVQQNIELPGKLLGKADMDNIEKVMSALKITGCRNKKPESLSVGERQRTAIARALSHRPPVIIADEPTAALDPSNAARVMDLFLDLAHSAGTTLLLVSHDRQRLSELQLTEVEFQMTNDADVVSKISRGL